MHDMFIAWPIVMQFSRYSIIQDKCIILTGKYNNLQLHCHTFILLDKQFKAHYVLSNKLLSTTIWLLLRQTIRFSNTFQSVMRTNGTIYNIRRIIYLVCPSSLLALSPLPWLLFTMLSIQSEIRSYQSSNGNWSTSNQHSALYCKRLHRSTTFLLLVTA